MSIIKGKTNIVAGFGGTKRCIGEVYFSQSGLASDNPGALPGWTGEYYENGKTLFPDLYNFVKAHSELQVTKTQYDNAIATYGECPKYVVDENSGTTTGTITVYGWLASASTFYTKTRTPVAGAPVWSSTDTTQASNYTVISLSNDTLTFSGPTKEWTGTYSTTTTGTGLVTIAGTSLRLPKLANYIKMAGADGITQKGAGLPDVKAYSATAAPNAPAWIKLPSYAKAVVNTDGNSMMYGSSIGAATAYAYVESQASLGNSVYGSSDTVTPAHTTLYPWISAFTSAVPASTAQAAEFTGALSGKANTDLSNVLANIDYVVESKMPTADDPSWYRKYKSGWLEQGGVFSSAGNVTYTITLLKPFANTKYTALLTSGYSTTTESGVDYVKTKTTTNMVVIMDNISGFDHNWEAKGMGA